MSDVDSSSEVERKREAARHSLDAQRLLGATTLPIDPKGFELVSDDGDHDHAVRITAKRVLFGPSPTIWREVWVARDPDTANDLLARALEVHTQLSGRAPVERDLEGFGRPVSAPCGCAANTDWPDLAGPSPVMTRVDPARGASELGEPIRVEMVWILP